MKNIKNEYKGFLDDIEKNIKDKDDLEYIKQRFSAFMDVVLNQMDSIMILIQNIDFQKRTLKK